MSEYDPLIKAIDRYLAKADDDLKDTLGEEGYIDPDATVDAINSFEDSLTDALEEERDHYIDRIKDKSVQEALDDLPDAVEADASDIAIAAITSAEVASTVELLVDSYIKSIDSELAFSTFTKRTTNWISSWSEELGKIMKLKSHEGVEKVLSDALANGDSIQTVVANLQDAYGFSGKRARATAITEMLTAHSVSAQEAYLQSPAVSQKMWRHTGAHKNEPRPNHVAMDGTIVDVNRSFILSGSDGIIYYPDYPRDTSLPPGERVNCHCISQPVVSKDVLGLDLKERQRLQQEAIKADDEAWSNELDARNKAKAGIEE